MEISTLSASARRCAVTAALALTAGFAFSPVAHADHLYHVGDETHTYGPFTTVAAQPGIAGGVIQDKLVTYDVTSNKIHLKGKVQVRVVNDKDGTLSFYYRVMPDAADTARVALITLDYLAANSKAAAWSALDIAARQDGLGTVAPVGVSRNGGNPAWIRLAFGFTGPDQRLVAGSSSRFLMVRFPGKATATPTDAYAAGGKLIITGIPAAAPGSPPYTGHTASAEVPIFVPIAAPAP